MMDEEKANNREIAEICMQLRVLKKRIKELHLRNDEINGEKHLTKDQPKGKIKTLRRNHK